jgi:hypothetical protein
MVEVACGRRSFRLGAVVAAAVAVFTIAAPVLVADAATDNAIANPSFETSTSGWNANGSGAGVTLTRVEGGHSGAWAARLTNGGTASANCLLNDSPNWVATTSTGTYTASLWVRADTPGATLKLKLREYRKDSRAFVGEAKSAIALTTAWQQVSVAYTPLAPGASTLDYTAYVANAAPGTCFYADDAAIAFDPAA